MSDGSKSSVEHLAEVATDNDIDVLVHSRHAATLTLPVVHATGKVIHYSVDVQARGLELEASESKAAHQLPRFCPDRHIVGDGTFCMYWEQEQRFPVIDPDSAKQWLCVLANFLRFQERATYLRRWPNEEAWAHGEAAARAQRRAEKLALNLGGRWLEWVLARELKVNREPLGAYRVERVGEALFATWQSQDRSRRLKGKGLTVYEQTPHGKTRCRNPVRALALNELAMALSDWQSAEDAFWKFFRDKPCCGTMDTCRLRKAS